MLSKKDYPRPQFVRENWDNWNGDWDFWFDDDQVRRQIRVPFSYETKASGIGIQEFHPVVWYERTLVIDEEKLKGNAYILHFEGSDYETSVWVNDAYVGSHKGAYERFSFDITDALKGKENKLVVRTIDSNNTAQPRGKQRWIKNNFGCWYVQTTTISWIQRRFEASSGEDNS